MIEYNVVGLCELFELLSWVGVCEVVIECLDGLVVDILFEVGIMVVVISFNQLKNLCGCYGLVGNKDDWFDVFVFVDMLCIDWFWLCFLLFDILVMVILCWICCFCKDFVVYWVVLVNQLCVYLCVVFLGVVGLFVDFDLLISFVFLMFLFCFDCQDCVDWLLVKCLVGWLVVVGYCGCVL